MGLSNSINLFVCLGDLTSETRMFIVYLTRGENQVQFWAIMTKRAWPWPLYCLSFLIFITLVFLVDLGVGL